LSVTTAPLLHCPQKNRATAPGIMALTELARVKDAHFPEKFRAIRAAGML